MEVLLDSALSDHKKLFLQQLAEIVENVYGLRKVFEVLLNETHSNHFFEKHMTCFLEEKRHLHVFS